MEKILGFINFENKAKFAVSFGIILLFLGLAIYPIFIFFLDSQTDKAIDNIKTISEMPQNSTERRAISNLVSMRLETIPGVLNLARWLSLIFEIWGGLLLLCGLMMWKEPA